MASGHPPSLHTAVRAHLGEGSLISPNLLIPALEFTNTCEYREHSHRVETAPPSRWESQCLDRLNNLLEKDCEAAAARSSCPSPCSRHCRAPSRHPPGFAARKTEQHSYNQPTDRPAGNRDGDFDTGYVPGSPCTAARLQGLHLRPGQARCCW